MRKGCLGMVEPNVVRYVKRGTKESFILQGTILGIGYYQGGLGFELTWNGSLIEGMSMTSFKHKYTRYDLYIDLDCDEVLKMLSRLVVELDEIEEEEIGILKPTFAPDHPKVTPKLKHTLLRIPIFGGENNKELGELFFDEETEGDVEDALHLGFKITDEEEIILDHEFQGLFFVTGVNQLVNFLEMIDSVVKKRIEKRKSLGVPSRVTF